MRSFEVLQEDRGEVQILTLVGEFESRAASDLRKRLMGTLADGRLGVLLDLARLESIAGDGLRVMIAAAARLKAAGGALALCCPKAQVRRVLEMTNLDRTLPIHPRREAAWDWLVETVQRERVARLAARLLRRNGKQPMFRIAKADARRATLAAQLLLRELPGVPLARPKDENSEE